MDTSGKNGCSLFLHPPPHHLRDKGFDFIYLFRNVVSNIDQCLPSQITLNVWGLLRTFQIICCSLGVSPLSGISFIFTGRRFYKVMFG